MMLGSDLAIRLARVIDSLTDCPAKRIEALAMLSEVQDLQTHLGSAGENECARLHIELRRTLDEANPNTDGEKP